jgi:hypothetical protein
MPIFSKLKILRSTQAARYVVAVQIEDKVNAKSFWSEAQALMSENVPSSNWTKVATEVFAAIHADETPSHVHLFAKPTRRGRVLGVVVWTMGGIYPKILPRLGCHRSSAGFISDTHFFMKQRSAALWDACRTAR